MITPTTTIVGGTGASIRSILLPILTKRKEDLAVVVVKSEAKSLSSKKKSFLSPHRPWGFHRQCVFEDGVVHAVVVGLLLQLLIVGAIAPT